jgi:hypothetical protein
MCVFLVSVYKAKEACVMDQLSTSIDAGIEGVIHVMRLLWQSHLAEEEWRLLLIDENNGFNKGNRRVMLWNILQVAFQSQV